MWRGRRHSPPPGKKTFLKNDLRFFQTTTMSQQILFYDDHAQADTERLVSLGQMGDHAYHDHRYYCCRRRPLTPPAAAAAAAAAAAVDLKPTYPVDTTTTTIKATFTTTLATTPLLLFKPALAVAAAAAAAVPAVHPAPYVVACSFCIQPRELVHVIYYKSTNHPPPLPPLTTAVPPHECIFLYNILEKRTITVDQRCSLLNLLHCPSLCFFI